jgi:hypothetical protein
VYGRCFQDHLATLLEGVNAMSKGLNSRKQVRKPATKTMMQKRAAKQAKKAAKGTIAQ